MSAGFIVLLVVGGLFTYSFISLGVHAVIEAMSLCDDSTDRWCVSWIWPLSLIPFIAWAITHVLPKKISLWRKSRKHAVLAAINDKYTVVRIPKGEIDTLKEYRSLGSLAVEIQDKLTKYEMSNNVPVTERAAQ